MSVHNCNYSGYLLVHFIGEQHDGEQVYFSYSEDGLHWKDLNAGLPVLRSELGEKGVRDPFLVRSPKEDKFYLIATDLRIANGKGWSAAANEGSRDIIIWESADLVHWSSPWAARQRLQTHPLNAIGLIRLDPKMERGSLMSLLSG